MIKYTNYSLENIWIILTHLLTFLRGLFIFFWVFLFLLLVLWFSFKILFNFLYYFKKLVIRQFFRFHAWALQLLSTILYFPQQFFNFLGEWRLFLSWVELRVALQRRTKTVCGGSFLCQLSFFLNLELLFLRILGAINNCFSIQRSPCDRVIRWFYQFRVQVYPICVFNWCQIAFDESNRFWVELLQLWNLWFAVTLIEFLCDTFPIQLPGLLFVLEGREFPIPLAK